MPQMQKTGASLPGDSAPQKPCWWDDKALEFLTPPPYPGVKGAARVWEQEGGREGAPRRPWGPSLHPHRPASFSVSEAT